MFIKKITAVLMSIIFTFGLVSCSSEKAEEISSENSVSDTVEMSGDGVTDIIEPDIKSEEYNLGSYRISGNGIKLYYEDDKISTPLMLTLEKYFTSFQNKDFELYKSCLASDYAERYNDYLIKNYSDDNEEYTLEKSFEMQCKNIRNMMILEITGEYDIPEDCEYTGDFQITRIKAEETELLEGETTDSLLQKFFSYDDDIFEMDYYNYIKEQADDLHYFTFYIIAEGEDGAEHRIISEMDIVFAEKDGNFYTFG